MKDQVHIWKWGHGQLKKSGRGGSPSKYETLTLKPYYKSLLAIVDLKYVYRNSGVVHSENNVWWKYQ